MSCGRYSKGNLSRAKDLATDGAYGELAFDHAGRHLAAAKFPHAIEVWSTKSWKQTNRIELSSKPADEFAIAMAFSRDDRRLAVGTSVGHLLVFDLDKPNKPLIQETEHVIHCVEFSPDGQYIVTGDQSGKLSLWQADSAAPLASWQAHSSPMGFVAFADQEGDLLSAGHNGAVTRWHLNAIREGLRPLGLDW